MSYPWGKIEADVATFRHAHLFCGIGAGAKGFNHAHPRVGSLRGQFECAGGIDVDGPGLKNFERMTGAKGTLLDLFDRQQYVDFHGKLPPPGWREATPADVYQAFGPDLAVAFTSAPCKGFSGLLSSTKSKTDKYQALNRLTIRGMWLLLEAYKHQPIPIILFENVPRIMTRGRFLLDQIIQLLRAYGYIVNEDVHDCGEIGDLAQTRKRFLLIARHPLQIPPFVYQPPKHRLRGVGEVIGLLPLPGDPVAGVHHRVPSLQWQTWVRLALVEAGKDWRSLNRLRVENGVLKDYGLVPDVDWRDNALGVVAWDESAGTIVGNQRSPLHGRHSVADPRPGYGPDTHPNVLGVKNWSDPAGVVSGKPGVTSGPHSVADPRPVDQLHNDAMGVRAWDDPARVVSSRQGPTNGAHSIADPRIDGHEKSVQLGVRDWDATAPCVKGDMSVGTGPYAVADVRLPGRPRFNNTYRIVRFDSPSSAVAGPGGPAGGLSVADPRPAASDYSSRKYKVHRMGDTTRAVIGASTTGDGAFAVADPRGGNDPAALHGKYPVEEWDEATRAVIGGRDQGAFAVADPRPNWGNRHEAILRVTPADQPAGTIPANAHSVTGGQPCVADARREHYQTGGHYGVVPWEGTALTVSGSASHDNGFNSVGDPRDVPLECAPLELPAAAQKLVCRIVAEDGTWHRPFTTLDLGSLQSLFDPEEAFFQDPATGIWQARTGFELIGGSDATVREWIGNAVPSKAAQGMATTIGETLLLAIAGEGFTLSTREIWVKPGALALAVDSRQPAFDMDGGLI
jgi:site-specific DNA-cytosine methylase